MIVEVVEVEVESRRLSQRVQKAWRSSASWRTRREPATLSTLGQVCSLVGCGLVSGGFVNTPRSRTSPLSVPHQSCKGLCPRDFIILYVTSRSLSSSCTSFFLLLTIATPSCKRKVVYESTSEERALIVSSAKMHARKLQAVSSFALVQARCVVAPHTIVIGAAIPP